MRALTRIIRIFLKEAALLSFELILVILIGVFSIAAFGAFVYLLSKGQPIGIDQVIFQKVQSFRAPELTSFMKGITFIGDPWFALLPIVLIIIYFLFIKPHRWYAIAVPVIAMGAEGVDRLLKNFFGRPRPEFKNRLVEVISELSFPSGHSMFSMAFYGLIIYLVWKYFRNKALKYTVIILLLILIHLIGISRVYLGVHFPTDVMAGFAAGFIWLVSSLWILKVIEGRIKEKEFREVHTE